MDVTIINADLSGVREALAEFAETQAPFAMAATLNGAAYATRLHWRRQVKARLDKPREYTVAALRVRPANKRKLLAELQFDKRQREYLRPVFEGGSRRVKRIEAKAGLPQAAPTTALERDVQGNVPKGQYIAIYRRYAARDKAIVKDPRGRPPGLYLRLDGKLRALFVSAPTMQYRKRFDMDRDIVARVRAELANAAPKAIRKALLTANKAGAKARKDAARLAREAKLAAK